MHRLTEKVAERYDGYKIPDFLRSCMGISVTLIKKVKYGGVFINGVCVTMRAKVAAGDTVDVDLPAEKSEGIRPIQMPLDIVYEDDHIIAVNKPRGMPTHPSKGNSLPTLAEGLMAYFEGQDFVFRSINRLDRDTSGIVIVAKDAYSAAKLAEEMKRGGYVKKYYAVVTGIPTPDHAVIEAPIERVEEGNIKRCVREDGKDAKTEYKVLSTDASGNSLCEITLYTGRTHQIRVHMAHIGHPLLYDFLYGESKEGLDYMLHARYIEFTHPITKKRITLISEPDFKQKEE